MSVPKITSVPSNSHAAVARTLEQKLLSTLAELNPQATNQSIVMTAKDASGTMIGGVSGATSYGWFLVKLLWVSQSFRGAGIGRKLMTAAEEEARAVGCHSAWLDTSNAEARAFYERLGYEEFGQLANSAEQSPSSHKRWFLKKVL